MPQDAFTLGYIARELNNMLVGGRVNKITQPNSNEINLSIYADRRVHRIVISALVSTSRIGTTSAEKENPSAAYNFCMLLRKHIGGATVQSVSLAGKDRVVKIDFSAQNEFYDVEEKTLYAEIMGKYSNVILTAGGSILGALKTAGLEEASKRPLITGLRYSPPPAQDKLAAGDAALVEVFNAYGGGDFADCVFKNVKGLSYETASEAVSRFYKASSAHGGDGAGFNKFLAEFMSEVSPKPCVRRLNGVAADFYVTPYVGLPGEYEYYPTVLEAQERFYGEKECLKTYSEYKRRLTECVKKEEKKLEKRLKIILEKQNDCKNLENDRMKGELILANIYRVKKGDKLLEADNYYSADGGKINVPLDENLTAQENAARYFGRYNKQKRTLVAVAPQREEVQAGLDYLKSVYAELELAEDVAALGCVESELKAVGLMKSAPSPKKKKAVQTAAYRLYAIDGITVKVGRNNVENEGLVSAARGKDIWLHTKGYHSSHVIVEVRDKPVPSEVLTAAAEICAYYSGGRDGGKIDVDYTEKRFVKKPPHAGPGFVIYTDFHTMTVKPHKHEEFLKNK